MPTKLQRQISGQFGSRVPTNAIVLDPLDNGPNGHYWLDKEAYRLAAAKAFIAKKKAEKRAKFFRPDQARDDRGRWTDEGGGSIGGKLAPSDDKRTNPAQLEKIVDDVALKLGTPSGVDTKYGGPGYKFTVGGQQMEAAGQYNPDTKEITIYDSAFEARPSLPTKDASGKWNISQSTADPYYLPQGIMAHEIQHAKFDQWLDQVNKERAVIGAMPEAEQAKYRTLWDPNNVENYLKLTPAGREKFKALALYQEMDKYWVEGRLEQEDGVSDYSKAYWKDYDNDKIGYMRASDETLAEVARIKTTAGNDAMISKLWSDLHEKIGKFTY